MPPTASDPDTPLPARAAFAALCAMPLRPDDCDAGGYLSVVAAPALVEAALRGWLAGALADDPHPPALPVFEEIALRRTGDVRFPAEATVGLRLSRLTLAAARLAVAVFPADGGPAALTGTLRLVFLDPATRRPVPVPPPLRTALAGLAGAGTAPAGLTALATAPAAE